MKLKEEIGGTPGLRGGGDESEATELRVGC